MSLPKAILIGLLAFAAMSAAGYVTAELALQGTEGGPSVTESGVTIVRSSLQGGIETQSRALAQVTATASPTPTATLEPSPTASPIPTATEEPPPPLPTETPEPPTATPEPPAPTATPEPLPPTPTPTPEPPPPTPTPEPPAAAVIAGPTLLLGSVTPYSDSLAGSSLGCNGYGVYDPANPTVIAVGWEWHEEWPCGTNLGLCAIDAATGVVTTCIVGVRQDTCPGCVGNHIDVSRAAFDILCGAGANRCTVVITPLP